MVIILKYFLGCLSRCTRIAADSAGSTTTSVVGSGWHERCHPTRLMRRRLDFRSSRYRSRVTSSTRRHVYPDSAGVTYALHITVCVNVLCNKPIMLLIHGNVVNTSFPPRFFWSQIVATLATNLNHYLVSEISHAYAFWSQDVSYLIHLRHYNNPPTNAQCIIFDTGMFVNIYIVLKTGKMPKHSMEGRGGCVGCHVTLQDPWNIFESCPKFERHTTYFSPFAYPVNLDVFRVF